MIALPPLILIQPPVPGVRLCPMHEYIFNTDIGKSKGYDPNEDKPESGRGPFCTDIPEPLGSCVWQNWDALRPKPSEYGLTDNNCQDAVNRVVEYCRKCRGMSAPPTPDFNTHPVTASTGI